METYTCSVPETETTVGQLAASHASAFSVFEKYGIDYCCGGKKSFEKACKEKNLDPAAVKAEILKTPTDGPSGNFHPERWSSSLLVDYIIENHHSYVREAIPEIQALLDKVCETHGKDRSELLAILDCFSNLAEELTTHMNTEEAILFPAIKNIDAEGGGRTAFLNQPISVMEREHESAGNSIKKIRSLSNNYSPPDFACPTYRRTYQRLREFNNDLMQHMHLENNILFERFRAN